MMDKTSLNETLRDHSLWLSDTGGRRANLSKADLREADLSGADLSKANLSGADLRGANLRHAKLSGADLRGANLSGADLRGADFRSTSISGADFSGASLDFSAFPLWCGSLDVKCDKRLAAQLAYHFCRLVTEDSEVKKAQKALKALANKFHRVDECGKIK